jgi:hypothetical protein
MLPCEQFDLLVKQCESDRYYKTFFSLGSTYRHVVRHIFPLRLYGRSL